MIIKARQVCILPSMLKNSIPINERNIDGFTSSSKLDAVIEMLLSRKGNGNGKLVFCHFREEIDVIISRLQKFGCSSVAAFDGRTSLYKRSLLLREDNEVLVLQIQTGCEGLNLQDRFSEVYFVSPTWNPAVEEQAIARCHRIGQIKPVHVFRFHMTTYQCISDNEENPSPSLDQYIQNIQSVKKDIINEIIY
jgi:SNF2 family DNA or RNA helicase